MPRRRRCFFRLAAGAVGLIGSVSGGDLVSTWWLKLKLRVEDVWLAS